MVPGIIHSSVARFAAPLPQLEPVDGGGGGNGDFLACFKALAAAWKPVRVVASSLDLVLESVPFMHSPVKAPVRSFSPQAGGGGGEGGEGAGGAAAAASAAPSEERIRTMLEKAGIQNVDPSALTTDDGFGDSGPSQATLNAMLRGEEVPAGVASTGGEEEEDDEDEAGISDERTLSFMQRVAAEPAQCLRYGRWGENETRPLWVASETIPVDVPACEHCGAPRDFEMQVMPQVLHFVGNGHGPDVGSTGLDFGTIAIYSCTNSCQGSSDYVAEYAWVQPHSEQTMIAATDTQKQQLASIAKPIEAAAATGGGEGGAGAGRGRTVIEEEDEEEEEELD
jgi:pre-rRNA-processing protein TSR4